MAFSPDRFYPDPDQSWLGFRRLPMSVQKSRATQGETRKDKPGEGGMPACGATVIRPHTAVP